MVKKIKNFVGMQCRFWHENFLEFVWFVPETALQIAPIGGYYDLFTAYCN